jgi:hypothetical protein
MTAARAASTPRRRHSSEGSAASAAFRVSTWTWISAKRSGCSAKIGYSRPPPSTRVRLERPPLSCAEPMTSLGAGRSESAPSRRRVVDQMPIVTKRRSAGWTWLPHLSRSALHAAGSVMATAAAAARNTRTDQGELARHRRGGQTRDRMGARPEVLTCGSGARRTVAGSWSTPDAKWPRGPFGCWTAPAPLLRGCGWSEAPPLGSDRRERENQSGR